MDLDYIKKHYQTLDDNKLKSLATQEAHTLRPEVIPVLMAEIKRRNLSDSLLEGMQTMLHEPTNEELNGYCNILQNLPCPVCKSKTSTLNAAITQEVVSVIVFSFSKRILHIACLHCLQDFKRKATAKTMMLGWWSPKGLFSTIMALIGNSKISKLNHHPSEILVAYAYENRGAIEAAKQNEGQLVKLLERSNAG